MSGLCWLWFKNPLKLPLLENLINKIRRKQELLQVGVLTPLILLQLANALMPRLHLELADLFRCLHCCGESIAQRLVVYSPLVFSLGAWFTLEGFYRH